MISIRQLTWAIIILSCISCVSHWSHVREERRLTEELRSLRESQLTSPREYAVEP